MLLERAAQSTPVLAFVVRVGCKNSSGPVIRRALPNWSSEVLQGSRGFSELVMLINERRARGTSPSLLYPGGGSTGKLMLMASSVRGCGVSVCSDHKPSVWKFSQCKF